MNPHEKEDMNYFRKRSPLINELDESGSGPWVYKVKVLKNHKQKRCSDELSSLPKWLLLKS